MNETPLHCTPLSPWGGGVFSHSPAMSHSRGKDKNTAVKFKLVSLQTDTACYWNCGQMYLMSVNVIFFMSSFWLYHYIYVNFVRHQNKELPLVSFDGHFFISWHFKLIVRFWSDVFNDGECWGEGCFCLSWFVLWCFFVFLVVFFYSITKWTLYWFCITVFLSDFLLILYSCLLLVTLYWFCVLFFSIFFIVYVGPWVWNTVELTNYVWSVDFCCEFPFCSDFQHISLFAISVKMHKVQFVSSITRFLI